MILQLAFGVVFMGVCMFIGAAIQRYKGFPFK